MASCETSAELMDLPEEILEYIFSLTSPYRDLQNLSTVCHRFHRICKGKYWTYSQLDDERLGDIAANLGTINLATYCQTTSLGLGIGLYRM